MAAKARGSLGTGVHLHESGLLFTSRQSLETWERVGANIFAFADSAAWWIADWLVYGESTFQGRYEEAVKRTPLSYQTLRNYTWVARKFPLSRRRQNLSFSHHLEVVALDQPQQDYWLRRAEELDWSRNKLRAEVRASLQMQHGVESSSGTEHNAADTVDSAAVTPAFTDQMRSLSLQLSVEDLAGFEAAAGKESRPVETWAVEMLKRAAARS